MKIEKLELKHLCGYLPYKLKIVVDEYDGKMLLDTIYGITNDEIIGENDYYQFDVNPLLLPLSALTEPLEDGTVPIEEIAKIHLSWVEGSDYNLKCEFIFQRQIHVTCKWNNTGSKDPYFDDSLFIQTVNTHKNMAWINEYLYSKHFDIYGLIDAGLAIDKRTVKT